MSEHIEVESMLENRGDIHHLFPKKYLTDHGLPKSMYNQIANYVFLQQEINIRIRDDAPCIYMKNILSQCESKNPQYGSIVDKEVLKDNLRQNCVPDGFENMDITDYSDFLVKRRKLMANKIREYYESL